MTSKERAALRAQANSLEALIYIGKSGITDALVKQTEDAIKAHELIKLKVHMETSPISPRDAANELAAAVNADVIQVIGGVLVLYRYNPELHEAKPKTVVAAKPDRKKAATDKKSPKQYGKTK